MEPTLENVAKFKALQSRLKIATAALTFLHVTASPKRSVCAMKVADLQTELESFPANWKLIYP
ncbi:hypothetical protein DES53_107274 [Roseimicrobium gellanilyticum]|uniref:Uncharacterized protein n=1 Tax=Roseimicrobium gellanilyticum TaxID=748857 RepID=A0A366HFV3_9BACT|nr:hypothetical protein DES53_107274 [Roseimicrobium gellanilyticum]